MTRSPWPLWSLSLALACGRSSAPPAYLAPAQLGDGSDDGSSSSSGVPEPDLPQDDAPCRRVDLLFVVDNSHSMADEQANLVASFPGFIDGIESILGASTDYHVGVITTDANEHNGLGCRTLGALTTRTSGEHSSEDVCGPYAEGGSYMSPRDQLADTFACAAQVGVEGSGYEQPMDAMIATLEERSAKLRLCNDGFLRDGALLVLTLITDEEDDGGSIGDPALWYEQVLGERDPSAVVVLSLVGHPKPNACIPAQWTGMDGAELAPRLIEFTEMFEYGRVGDVCAPEYGTFFADALSGIAEACHVVIPPA
ncbi:MAG: hypothetical protein IAG13_25750 [Deltaproteobacteria bacterium]|nr:hypothetical protein [Nannocystaceae bacterium]